MQPRVTQEDVKAIFETDVTLAPFIATANLTVNNNLVGKGLDDATLTEIERWLSAHFAAVRDPRVHGKGLDGASVTFEGHAAAADTGLKSTQYGQQVLTLDWTGTLARLGEKQASLTVIGGR